MSSLDAWDWKSAKCSKCGRGMEVLTAGGLGVAVPQTPEIQRMVQTGELKGTFSCLHCGSFTCYDCSDAERPCECGKILWVTGVYREAGAKGLWKRLFGRD